MRIACLHTADSNVAVFDTVAQQLNLPQGSLRHEVRADLLAAAELARGLTPDIERQTCDALLNLGRGADVVLLTCSTLGPCISAESANAPVPMIRVDSALAEEATRAGGKVIALCAVETTLAPTARIFTDAAKRSGAEVEIRLVQGAWQLFKAGEQAVYLAKIAAATEDAYQDGATIVALAQASMAGAAALLTQAMKPLTSPASGLIAAMNAMRP
ncbi:aspartate/glutamate racemase family protein [Paraburkholderia terrae]|uniref:aspartate/glutamate racemase family protein n=1 Tax=Paraburkholderia terrae TaxID=311230 RepID=UPI00296A92A5|nr:aspartate/glutamate racemase family protein [Paraburkholderia terrae]MDW3655811.1 aspartate/glutamate racemase family protein [Paraburkholderia terrae]